MTHKEKNDACQEAYKQYQVDELREAYNAARNVCERTKVDYLVARENYHKAYRKIWNS